MIYTYIKHECPAIVLHGSSTIVGRVNECPSIFVMIYILDKWATKVVMVHVVHEWPTILVIVYVVHDWPAIVAMVYLHE